MLVRPSPFLAKPHLWLLEGTHCFLFDNEYPVIKGHVLAVPKRELENFMDLSVDEWLDIRFLTRTYIEKINAVGFNLGFNGGEIAGQTVAHIHFHIFPHFPGSPGMPEGGYLQAFGDMPGHYKSGKS